MTPGNSPDIPQNKSFIKNISPFHYGSNKSSPALKRVESPGMSARSFIESPNLRNVTRSPDGRPNIGKASSTHSVNSVDSHKKSSKLPYLKFGSRSSSSHRKSSNKKSNDDDDWDVGFTPVESNYPNLSSLSLNDNSTPGADGYVMIHKNEANEEKQQDEPKIVIERDENYSCLKKGYRDIIEDPYNVLKFPVNSTNKNEIGKYNKLVKILTVETFDMKKLKDISWKGIPNNLRGLIWSILVNYLSTNESTRVSLLDRKRKEYSKSIARIHLQEKQERIWHQIHIDIPRTNPGIKLYTSPITQRSLENILYLWAIRHPASGYVQGINDLVTPFYQVFMSQYLTEDIDIENFDPKELPSDLINIIEADTFWCLTKVLDTIQDNYIHEQPGIFRQIDELKRLIDRDEKGLALHFANENIDFIQFAFRWMNCMLMREFKLSLIIRMWDTYLSEFPNGYSDFHVYVCCAFLRKFTDVLMEMDFQDVIMFLQDNSKTENWEESDIEILLSEAYLWEMLYGGTQAHYK